jgi:hypothetical protein
MVRAQAVPGRDLLDFPLGAIAEPQVMALQLASGFWNPAAVALSGSDRFQIGIAALNSPVDQGVSEQLVAGVAALPWKSLLVVSLARASLSDLARTETDPQTIGAAIPYGTTLGSIGIEHRLGSLSTGLALRYRSGTSDFVDRGAVSVDGGLVLDRAFGTPLRIAGSTFLLSPQRSAEAASVLGAVDGPVFGRDSMLELRAGLAAISTRGRGDERYLYTTLRYGTVEARGGIARSDEFGNITDHVRLGLALRYARYTVGIAREEQGAGLGATYQFLLTSSYQ